MVEREYSSLWWPDILFGGAKVHWRHDGIGGEDKLTGFVFIADRCRSVCSSSHSTDSFLFPKSIRACFETLCSFVWTVHLHYFCKIRVQVRQQDSKSRLISQSFLEFFISAEVWSEYEEKRWQPQIRCSCQGWGFYKGPNMPLQSILWHPQRLSWGWKARSSRVSETCLTHCAWSSYQSLKVSYSHFYLLFL